MKTCAKHGGAYWNEADKFCPDCGEQLVPFPRCLKCDCELLTSDKFCRGCGAMRQDALFKPETFILF